jgi:AcrR family transcriptional regulator
MTTQRYASLHSSIDGQPAVPAHEGNGAVDSRRRILDETIEAIDNAGESSVRLTQVSRRAGVTQGLIAYHFGDREALVSEAQAVRFSQVTDQLVSDLDSAARQAHTAGDIRDLLHRLVDQILTAEVRDQRERRVSALAASLTRPDARSMVAARLSELHTVIESIVARAQSLGILRSDIDPLVVSTMISTISLGGIALDLDAGRLDEARAATIRSQMVDVLCSGLGLVSQELRRSG